jgi:RND family efflux transporter MFP subunit
MRNPVLPILALLLAVATTPVPADESAPTPVAVHRLQSGDRDLSLSLTAVVSTPRIAQVSARVAGLLETIAVDAGDAVDAGAPIAQLDDTLARLTERRVEAAVAEAQVALEEAERLRSEGERLGERGNLPASEVETRRANVALARAARDRLRAEAAEARELRRRHAVLAPFSGTVSLRRAQPGEWLATGAPVVELVDLAGLRLDVQVPQEAYRNLALDQPVTINLDADAQSLPGRISARVPQASTDGRTFLLRVAFDTPPEHAVPGMTARVDLPLQRGDYSVQVPRDALIRRADGSTRVWVADTRSDPPLARSVNVRAGAARGDTVDVRGDLAAGDLLVVRGNERLRDGQPLTIRNDD